jgi:uncharacterized protein
VLNTLTRAVIHADEEVKKLLDENPGEIPSDILEIFIENGLVVEDGCDERKIVAHHFDREKYNVIPNDLGYTIAITYNCNLRCPYCYEGLEKDTGALNDRRIDILLNHMDKNLSRRDFKKFRVGLYGGEPLVAYKQCIRLMEGAFEICTQQEREWEGAIITNGVLITEDVIDELLEPYCTRIQLTMDGGREAHNKRRIRKDGTGTYDILLNVIELLKNTEIEVNLRFNVDRENVDSFSGLFNDLIDRGLENIETGIGWIHPPDSERIGEGCPGYSEKCFSHKEMVYVKERLHNQMDEAGIIRKGVPMIPRNTPCTFDREDVFLVDPYLDLYNCWEFLGQKDKKVGYIDTAGETVFNWQYYEQMSRNPLEFEDCRECKYLPFCGGGCAARAYLEKGTIHASSCGQYEYAMEKYLEKYIQSISS